MAAPKRHRKRIKMVLPIRVWGTDANGKPFVCLSHTLDVTPHGARIGGFSAVVSPGERVGITRGMQKAHFRVAWVGQRGSPTEDQIGVQLLELDKDIWGLKLPEAEPDDYGAAEARNNAAAAPVSAPAVPRRLDTAYITDQVRKAVQQLQRVEELIKNSSVDPAVLREFRTSVSHARNTSWAVEKWLAGGKAEDPYSVLVFLNTERVQIAASMCAALAQEFPNIRTTIPKATLESLLQSVGELFSQLANFEFEEDAAADGATPPSGEVAPASSPTDFEIVAEQASANGNGEF